MEDASEPSDPELVERARAGEREAFGFLYRRHQSYVYRFARAMTGSSALAEDIVQEVFLALMRDLDRYEHAEGFKLATRADLENHGYGFPPAAREAEDGTIRRGPDVALYVRSGEVARMWEAAKFADQAELAGAPQAFNAGGYSAEAFDEAEKRETITVKH